MTSITRISLYDIKLFLSQNNIETDNYYEIAEDLIVNSKAKVYPDTIIDWIVARNFYLSGYYIKSYSKSEVLQLSNQELNDLAEKLDTDTNNRNSIVNILYYLEKLKFKSYLDILTLPELNIKIIEHSDPLDLLDKLQVDGSIRPLLYRAIPQLLLDNGEKIIEEFIKKLGEMREFRLLQKAFEGTNEHYIKYLDLNSLIGLLKYDPKIEDIIDRQMKTVILYHITGYQFLRALIFELGLVKNFKLMKRLIDESNKIYPITETNKDKNHDLFRWLIDNNDVISIYEPVDTVINFLQLVPNYHWTQFHRIFSEISYLLKGKRYFDFRIKIFKAAIAVKNEHIIDYFTNQWNHSRNNWFGYIGDRFTEEEILDYIGRMDVLVKKI